MDQNNIEEEWRQIENYPDYFVSNMGNVYSDKRHKLMKPVLQKDGYVRIALRNEDGSRLYHIQRLVLEAFTGKHDEFEANHIRNDNRLENLEWVTRSQNVRDTISSHGYEFSFVESLPEGSIHFESYGNHEFENYYINGNQLFLFIEENRYRVLDVRYDNNGYPYYNAIDTNHIRTHIQLTKI